VDEIVLLMLSRGVPSLLAKMQLFATHAYLGYGIFVVANEKFISIFVISENQMPQGTTLVNQL